MPLRQLQQGQLQRGILAILIWLALAFLGIGIWLASQSPLTLLQAQTQAPSLISLVPRSATVVAAITTPLQDLEAFHQAAVSDNQRRRIHQLWRRALSTQSPGLGGSFLKLGDLSFERDIRPWLGSNLVWAQVPNGDSSGTLLILETEDPEQSNFSLNLLWQRLDLAGIPFHLSLYKGVQILATDPAKEQEDRAALATAAFGNLAILIADDEHLIETAIDAWQIPSLSLSTLAAHSRTLPSQGVGWLYWHPLQAQGLGSPDVALSLGLEVAFDGIHLETLAHGMAASFDPVQTVQTQPLLTHIPPQAGLILTGKNLGSAFDPPQAMANLPVWLTNHPPEIEINWTEDWRDLTGGYALALVPGTGPQPDWILVAQDVQNTAQNAAKIVEKLDQKATNAGLQVKTMATDQEPITAWFGADVTGLDQSLALNQDPTLVILASDPDPQPIPLTLEGSMPEPAPVQPAPEPTLDPVASPEPSPLPSPLPSPPPAPKLPPALLYHRIQDNLLYLSNSQSLLEQAIQGPGIPSSKLWQQASRHLSPQDQGLLYVNTAVAKTWTGYPSLPITQGLDIAATLGIPLPSTLLWGIQSSETIGHSPSGEIQTQSGRAWLHYR